jgi:hypothetical protein
MAALESLQTEGPDFDSHAVFKSVTRRENLTFMNPCIVILL